MEAVVSRKEACRGKHFQLKSSGRRGGMNSLVEVALLIMNIILTCVLEIMYKKRI